MERIEYPEEFYQKEVRDGFEISSMMKRCWCAEMEVLREVDAICKRHGLRWYADAGTLLGAVREHGYIPWDDDIDIAMMRTDYERFCRYAQKELPEGYLILNDRNGDLTEDFFGIANSNTIRMDDAFLERYHGFPYPVAIDIFVWDNVPDEEAERETYIELFSLAYASGAEVKAGQRYEDCSEEVRDWIKRLEEMTCREIHTDRQLKKSLLLLADQIAAMYFDAETKYVAQAWKLAENHRLYYEKRWFEDVVSVPFERITVPIPVGYHDILTRRYGDYMKKVRAGVATHDYPAYKRYEDALFRSYEEKGLPIPEWLRV